MTKPGRALHAVVLLSVALLCALLVVACCLVCSCARRGVPPGGPVDLEPPRVLSTFPDSGRVSVGSVPEVCLTFSEQMDRETVRDAVVLRPAVGVGGTKWRKNVFCLTLAESLKPATTYSLTLMTGSKDLHGNTTREPRAFVFSTGDSIAAGAISGVVTAKTLPAPGIPVWAFDSLVTPRPDFTKDDPLYVSQAGSKGEFKFVGVPSGTYLLFAFKDKDGNRAYDQGTDFASPAEAAVHVTPDQPIVEDVKIALVDPKEPGGVRGVVLHCFVPESVAIAVTVVSPTDTAASFSTAAGRDSAFSVGDVPAGRYTVNCFVDSNRNGVRDSGEVECREPHTVEVTPGDVVTGVKLEVPCAGKPLGAPQTEGLAPEKSETQAPGVKQTPPVPDTTVTPAAPDTTRSAGEAEKRSP